MSNELQHGPARDAPSRITDTVVVLCPLLVMCSSNCPDASQAECLGLRTQILYYMLRLYHHMADSAQENATAARLDQVEKSWTHADATQSEAFLDQIRQILDITVMVAGYVASGEAASERLNAS